MNAQADAFMAIFGMKRVKPKRCKACRQMFTPDRPLQSVCDWACGKALVEQNKLKKDKAYQAQLRKDRHADTKARKDALKTRRDYINEAQRAFNAYIRARDSDKSCICCGNPLSSGSVGGSFDCGHYRSVGSAPHLRFDERNAHGQRKQCNRWGSGRAVDYRIGLVARIGAEAVEALEADNTPAHWTIDDLKAIKADYRAKLKQLKEREGR